MNKEKMLDQLKELLEGIKELKGIKISNIEKSDLVKDREVGQTHDIYDMANNLPCSIFNAEMWNAQSIKGAYIEAAKHIGQDKDVFKKKIEEFKDCVKDALGNFDSALKNWDKLQSKFEEEIEKECNG